MRALTMPTFWNDGFTKFWKEYFAHYFTKEEGDAILARIPYRVPGHDGRKSWQDCSCVFRACLTFIQIGKTAPAYLWHEHMGQALLAVPLQGEYMLHDGRRLSPGDAAITRGEGPVNQLVKKIPGRGDSLILLVGLRQPGLRNGRAVELSSGHLVMVPVVVGGPDGEIDFTRSLPVLGFGKVPQAMEALAKQTTTNLDRLVR